MLQEDFAQPEQPPPADAVNFPPLLAPKTENFFSTFLPEHEGQVTDGQDEPTSFSNSWPQRLQRNS